MVGWMDGCENIIPLMFQAMAAAAAAALSIYQYKRRQQRLR